MAEKLASEEVKYEPICPHCERKMNEVHWRSMKAFHAEYMFMCPHCRKVLGIGVRKSALIN